MTFVTSAASALRAVASVCLLSTVPAAHAETYAWKEVAIGAGGFITGYSTDRTGTTRVIRADVYGAYRWEDDADRWVQIVTSDAMPDAFRDQNGMVEGVYALTVAPTDPDRLYMAARDRLFTSRDAGRSWAVAGPPAAGELEFDPNDAFRHSGPALAVLPDDPDRAFFGSPQQGVWRTVNGGDTWEHVPDIPASAPPADAPEAGLPGIPIWTPGPAQVWAYPPGGGLYGSTDGGMTFAKVDTVGDTAPYRIRRAAFRGDDFYAVGDGIDGRPGIWRLRDGTWANLADRAGLSPRRAFAGIAMLGTPGHFIVSGIGGTMMVTRDDGRSWAPLGRDVVIPPKEPPWLRVSDRSYFSVGSVMTDPLDPDLLWLPTGVGVFSGRVIGGEIRLESQSRGIEELVANDVIHPAGQAPLFAAWDFGIHRREDLDSFSTGYGPRERVLIAAQQLDWSAGTPSFIVTNASDTLRCCDYDGDAVLAGYSEDSGRTWQKFATLPTPPGQSADDPFRMSFGSIAVASDDVNTIVWMPSFGRAPFYTRDRGKTWTRVVFEGEVLPNTGAHQAFYLNRKVVTADRTQPGTFYILHDGGAENGPLAGLWRSEDYGQSWQQVHRGPVAGDSGQSAKLRSVPGHAGMLYATPGTAHDDPGLFRSTDGGAHWERLPRISQVDDIAFGVAAEGAEFPAIYISGRVEGVFGIWRSVDEGATWHRLVDFPLGRLDQVTALAADPTDEFGLVYIAYRGSGWVYGRPEACSPGAYEQGDTSYCFEVEGQ